MIINASSSLRTDSFFTHRSHEGKTDKSDEKRSAVFSGGATTSLQDYIGNRKALANRNAMKKILDQFSVDTSLDDGVKSIENQTEQIQEDSKEAAKQLKELEANKEYYDEDEYNALKEQYESTTENAKEEMLQNGKTLSGIRIARVKSHAMVDAQKEADQIQQAASKDAVSLLMNDARQNVDDKVEKETEEISEAQEEKEAEEKAQASKDAENGEQTTTTDSAALNETVQSDQIQKVQKFIQKEQILPDDYKGLLVDAGI